MLTLNLLTVAAYAAALVATLALAAYLTPAHWWRQLNARALSVVAIGTWGIGSAILWLAQGATPAMAATPATGGVAQITAVAPAEEGSARTYRVREALNIREGKGTGTRRVAVAPEGSDVHTTGLRDGDWWQVRATIGGEDVTGWASSLWLRRADESRR